MSTESGKELAGLRVVVTRAPHQAQETLEAFRSAGARAVALPLLEVTAVDPADSEAMRAALDTAAFHDWLAFTSANAVRTFLPHLDARKKLQIATVGGATAEAVRESGFEVTRVAEEPRAEGLLAALLPHLRPGERILLPQADDARPTLADGLRQAGHEVTTVTAYTKGLPAEAPARARELFLNSEHTELGWVTFTSPRTVAAFVGLMEGLLEEAWPQRQGELRALSIGPVTSEALRRHGLEPAAEAAEPSSAGLVNSMRRKLLEISL